MTPTLPFWPTAKQWLRDFTLPDKTVSLKLVFDNLRNYLLCVALAAAVLAIYQPHASDSTWPWGLQVLVAILASLNMVQSWYIIQGAVESLRTLPRTLRSIWLQRLVKLVLICTVVMVVAASMQLVPLLLMVIASAQAK